LGCHCGHFECRAFYRYRESKPAIGRSFLGNTGSGWWRRILPIYGLPITAQAEDVVLAIDFILIDLAIIDWSERYD